MGFINLAAFNMAMLAKQAWRVVSNPLSLVARIYKARYFPYGSFWTAFEHASPSYSWRRLFGTQDLLKQGSCWQVGDAKNILIWTDNWIPGVPSFKPTLPEVHVDDLARVNELIGDPGSWDGEKVRSLFSHQDVEAVLSIPLSIHSPPDHLTWQPERHGGFTVKLAYRLETSLTEVTHSDPEVRSLVQNFWKAIWSSKVSGSVKFCIWKLCHNILPTLDRLATRRVELESQICPLCNVANETNVHIGSDCSFTRDVLSTDEALAQVCFRIEGADFEFKE